MGQHIRSRLDHRAQRLNASLEVRDQHFYTNAGAARPRLSDCLGKNISATVFQIVAIHRRYDSVFQIELLNRGGNALRFVEVVFRRPACLHSAEFAGARAYISQNHERCRPRFPALADVRTPGILAYRIQPLRADQSFQVEITLAVRQAHLQPFGARFSNHASVAQDLERTFLSSNLWAVTSHLDVLLWFPACENVKILLEGSQIPQ